jgi:hypothetical protein
LSSQPGTTGILVRFILVEDIILGLLPFGEETLQT